MPFRKLIDGYREFHKLYFKGQSDTYAHLVQEGQKPEALVIACSDSRIDPAIVTGSGPGDIFVVRNVAAIVPPYEKDNRHHGTSAAMEFAVKALKVKRIVVMGHSLCGGVQALADKEVNADAFDFIGPWMNIGEPARQAVEKSLADAPEAIRQKALEQAVILTSLKNLMTFPWVAERVNDGSLKLHGWYFDLTTGELSEYDPETSLFTNVLLKTDSELDGEGSCCSKISISAFLKKAG